MAVSTKVKLFFATVAGTVTAWIGGWDTMLKVLLGLMFLDYATGVYAAWYEKRLNSEVGGKGIIRKVLILVVVVVAAQVDLLLGTWGESLPFLPEILSQILVRSLAICFYIANESLSIFENVAKAGVAIPGFLKGSLEQVRDKAGSGGK
jgi:toxin secretion/phage lysis holin